MRYFISVLLVAVLGCGGTPTAPTVVERTVDFTLPASGAYSVTDVSGFPRQAVFVPVSPGVAEWREADGWLTTEPTSIDCQRHSPTLIPVAQVIISPTTAAHAIGDKLSARLVRVHGGCYRDDGSVAVGGSREQIVLNGRLTPHPSAMLAREVRHWWLRDQQTDTILGRIAVDATEMTLRYDSTAFRFGR